MLYDTTCTYKILNLQHGTSLLAGTNLDPLTLVRESDKIHCFCLRVYLQENILFNEIYLTKHAFLFLTFIVFKS